LNSESSTYLKEVYDYKTRCLKDPKRWITGVLIDNFNKTFNQYCIKDSKITEDFIQSAPCMNRATDELNKCNTNLIDVLMGSKDELNATKKISYACW
jgi:hypothetical protein